MAKNDRFEVVWKEGSEFRDGTIRLLVDKETGVTYILWKEGYGGGITPMIDQDGKPIITLL